MENRALLDFGSYPEIYADGVGDVLEIAPNAHIMLFRWRSIDGVLRRVIAGEVIRPVASVAPALLAAWRAKFTHGAYGAVAVH